MLNFLLAIRNRDPLEPTWDQKFAYWLRPDPDVPPTSPSDDMKCWLFAIGFIVFVIACCLKDSMKK